MRDWMLKLRKECNLTQQNVAETLGITKQFYQQIESGERLKDIPTGMVIGLSNAFNVSALKIVEMEQEYQKTNKST